MPGAADAPSAPPVAAIDHVVIAAATLEQGVAWCEATLGVAPGPGGKHALFGTHNRLLKIESAAFPRAYLEIIAVDPDAPAPPRPRWFGLDEELSRRRLAEAGPQLWHVAARTTAIDAHLAALAAAGLDAGVALAASRQTPAGLLQWRIAVRGDGRLLCGGALPTLIEWPASPAGPGVHPTLAMPPSAVRLREVSIAGVPPRAVAALGLSGVRFVAQSAPPAQSLGALRVGLDTPRGPVTLESA
ncbi:MAG: VOC family protein [Burkholderiales bacterium]|nr:VOC family protein [Burkholderiales bacterium]